MIDVLSAVLLLGGVVLAVLSGYGLQHLPDVLARMHAATKPASLGLLMVLGGTALQLPDRADVLRLLLVAAFQVVTAPVSAHMVGRVAYRAGAARSTHLVRDELAGAFGRDARSSVEGESGSAQAGGVGDARS